MFFFFFGPRHIFNLILCACVCVCMYSSRWCLSKNSALHLLLILPLNSLTGQENHLVGRNRIDANYKNAIWTPSYSPAPHFFLELSLLSCKSISPIFEMGHTKMCFCPPSCAPNLSPTSSSYPNASLSLSFSALSSSSSSPPVLFTTFRLCPKHCLSGSSLSVTTHSNSTATRLSLHNSRRWKL